jgi:predicted DNA-binding transcriptional regulator YafY
MAPRVGRPKGINKQGVRLVRLYHRLLQNQPVSLATLAAENDISTRTLQRDLQALQQALEEEHASERVVNTNGTLVRLQRQASQTPPQLYGMAMLIGLRMMQFLSGRKFDANLEAIANVLQDQLPDRQRVQHKRLARMLYISETGHKQYRDNPEVLKLMDKLVAGMLSQQPISLSYLSPRRKLQNLPAVHMHAQALCLVIHRGAVYFVVDIIEPPPELRSTRILLALDRIESAHLEAGRRSYPKDFDPADHFKSAFGVYTGTESHHVSLRVRGAYATAVRERSWPGGALCQALPGGDVRLTMTLGHLDEVADWVLGMAEHVYVEAPPELVELVRTRMQKALQQYR